MEKGRKQTDERRILVALDGPDVSPEHVDVPAFLELAAAFFQLVRASAVELDTPIELKAIAVIDKCAAIAVDTDSPALAKECAGLALVQIAHGGGARGMAGYVERARSVIRSLPPEQHAEIIIGEWKKPILATPAKVAPLDEIVAGLRVRPIRVGGKKPAVRFDSLLEEDFTLEAEPEKVREIAAYLYREVEIDARLSRDGDGNIDGGQLHEFVPVEDGDPRPAWREWFSRVNGGRHDG